MWFLYRVQVSAHSSNDSESTDETNIIAFVNPAKPIISSIVSGSGGSLLLATGGMISISGYYFGSNGLYSYPLTGNMYISTVLRGVIYGSKIGPKFYTSNCNVTNDPTVIHKAIMNCTISGGIGGEIYYRVYFGSLKSSKVKGPSYPPPVLTSMVPSSGSDSCGGDIVSITGTGFDPLLSFHNMQLYFGNTSIPFYASSSDVIYFILPRINETVHVSYSIVLESGGQFSTNQLLYSYIPNSNEFALPSGQPSSQPTG